MDRFETLRTAGLWCIALVCVVNGLMLDLALERVLASITQTVRDFVGGLSRPEQRKLY
jgi:hypothetical protein